MRLRSLTYFNTGQKSFEISVHNKTCFQWLRNCYATFSTGNVTFIRNSEKWSLTLKERGAYNLEAYKTRVYARIKNFIRSANAFSYILGRPNATPKLTRSLQLHAQSFQ